MAIPPTQLTGRHNKIVQDEADRLEKVIDQHLECLQEFFYVARVTLAKAPGHFVLEELRRRYLAVGWVKLEYDEGDQRDPTNVIILTTGT